MRKRISASAVVCVVLTLFAFAAAPAATGQGAPTEAKLQRSIQVRTSRTAAVTAGDSAWVTVSIRGRKDVDNVRFTAALSDGGGVTYPANTVDHSGPYNGYDLDRRETDYVAFKLTVPSEVTKRRIDLELTATWTEGDQAYTGSRTVEVPVVQFDGEPYQLLTDEVTLTEANNGWVALDFAGQAPLVEDVEVHVQSPTGLDLYFPLGTHTSLANDEVLEDGETDQARFRVNEPHWGEDLDLTIEVRYTINGDPSSDTHGLLVRWG